MKTELEKMGVYQPVSPLDMPLQIMGFVKRKHKVETKHTVQHRYYWAINLSDGWSPTVVVDIRYWKGDNARPVKYNIKAPAQLKTSSYLTDRLITTDPSEAIDFINEEILKCQQH